MNFETYKTERLILKKTGVNELNHLFENCTEAEVSAQLGLGSSEEYLKEKRRYEKGYSDFGRSILSFLLLDKNNSNVIGKCGYHNWIADHHRAEIGYALTREDYKQKGLMTEALKLVIDYGFNTMNLNRIEACVAPDNLPSIKLLQKFNFKEEGVLRMHYFINGRYEDSIMYSLLKKDNQNIIK